MVSPQCIYSFLCPPTPPRHTRLGPGWAEPVLTGGRIVSPVLKNALYASLSGGICARLPQLCDFKVDPFPSLGLNVLSKQGI